MLDLKSVSIGFATLAVITWIALPGKENLAGPGNVERRVAPMPEFDSKGQQNNTNPAELIARYEKLSTPQRPKQSRVSEPKPKPKTPPKKVIDDTIYPFFARYDKDHQMGLAGTFFDDGGFAVIQLINFETKKATFHEVKEGDTFGRFSIAKLSREEIVLASKGAEMTLTMFKKRK